MDRKLVSVQRITSLSPIEGADKIQKATILGWECVVANKDNFKVGDMIVYCEVDSILPDRPEFEFLRDRKFRIKTIRLKGQVSQGIVFPLSVLPQAAFNILKYREGQDVTDILGVRKYDPQAELEKKETDRLASIDKNRMDRFLKRYKWYRNLILKPTKKPFPAFISKTDEDRVQLIPDACEKWKGVPFEVTEKIDGQSATYFCIPNPRKGLFQKKWIFGVCSRNFQLLKEDNSSYWTIAKRLDLKNRMIKCCGVTKSGIILQGEIIGSKIQGNKYNRNGYEFYLFNAIYYSKGKNQVCPQPQQTYLASEMGLSTVPWLKTDYMLPYTIAECVNFAKGNSMLCSNPVLREGIVVRNYAKGISFKVINPDFLLKNEE